MSSYIGWPTNVNQIIYDETSTEIGSSALIQEESQNGTLIQRNKNGFVPDIFKVVMLFDYTEKDSNNMTEIDRFIEWYKYKAKYGSVPFEFKTLITSSDYYFGNNTIYQITSSVVPVKEGLNMKVSMTWQSLFVGTITIPTTSAHIDHIGAVNGRLTIVFTEQPAVYPLYSDFTITINDKTFTKTSFYFDGNVDVIIGFAAYTTSGTYTITVNFVYTTSFVV
jgi:hypothetical protein